MNRFILSVLLALLAACAVAQEIVVRKNGSFAIDTAENDANLPDQIQSGQAEKVAMPAAYVGTPASRSFIIQNTDTTTALSISVISVPAGYTVTAPAAFPASVPANGSITLTIRQDAAGAGYCGQCDHRQQRC